jgi:hypothetical protein
LTIKNKSTSKNSYIQDSINVFYVKLNKIYIYKIVLKTDLQGLKFTAI